MEQRIHLLEKTEMESTHLTSSINDTNGGLLHFYSEALGRGVSFE